CIGPTWKIKSVQLLSGEIDGSTKTQKVQRTIKAPVSGSSVQVKAGQDLRLELYVPKEASKTAATDCEAVWAISSAMANYGGDVVAHYYTKGLAVVPLTPFVELIPGESTTTEFQVINPMPVAGKVTFTPSSDEPNGVSFKPKTVEVKASGGIATVKIQLTAAKGAKAEQNVVTTFDVATSGLKLKTCVVTDVMQAFYTWGFDGSSGKVNYTSAIVLGSNGLFRWSGHLHDTSTFFGDDYAFAIWFNAAEPNGAHIGQTIGGSLGASLSGPSQDRSFDLSCKKDVLADNFAAYANDGWSWHTETDWNWGQLFSSLGKWIKDHIGEIIAVVGAAASA
ncbi:MAG: COG1470 family protein, partial [Fimbriimonadaceae bacterium]